MKSDPTPSLAQQAERVRFQLRDQRARIAAQLSAGSMVRSDFPRSMTMRFLVSRPALLPRLVTLLAGARFAAVSAAAFAIFRTLRTSTPISPRAEHKP